MQPGLALHDVMAPSGKARHHVEEEETELFPELRKTDVDLVALGGTLSALKPEPVTLLEP